MKAARLQLQSSVQGIVRGRYEGSFIDGLRDSNYDLHRHVLLPLQLDDGDLNPLCIFVLILSVPWHDFFVFYYIFNIKHNKSCARGDRSEHPRHHFLLCRLVYYFSARSAIGQGHVIFNVSTWWLYIVQTARFLCS